MTTTAQPYAESPQSTTREPTDAEVIAKVAAARKRVTFVWGDGDAKEEPKGGFVPLAAALKSAMPGLPVAPGDVGVRPAIEMWEPPCVSCGALLGYHARLDYYAPGKSLCADCRGANLAARLKASGISYREMHAPLDSLVRPKDDPLNAELDPQILRERDAEFMRYMAFLRTFAAIEPEGRIDPPFAFVYGNLGTGKSAGAERALRDAITNGCSGRTVKFGALVRMIYDTYNASQKSTPDYDARDYRTESILSLYSTTRLLVIHEVGPDADSDHALSLFFDFVDDRHQAMLPTIFTSNYAPDVSSLGARMGGRARDDVRVRGIIDRISGGVRENIFCLLGPSWRGREGRPC